MKASKMVACLSVSAVFLSLFASGASVTVADTQPSAAAVLQAEEYVEDSLAAYLAAHAFDGTLSGRTISLPVAEEGVTSDLEQPVSWTFECEEAGFYNVYVEYIPLPGTGEAIERNLLLDGESPYKGMEQLVFQRSFDNTSGEEIPMKGNEEIRPRATEVFERSGVYLSDSKKRSAIPYVLYLSQGSHTLTLEPVKESMQIFAVELKAAPEIQPYAETGLDEKPRYTGDPLTYQAERIDGGTKAVLKSAQSIRNEVDQSSPDTVPFHPYYRRLNVIGGSSWRYAGQSITWEIEVPEEGLYALSFRARNVTRGVTSYRRLYIGGQTPFQEAQSIGFAFSGDYKQYDLSENGTYIYLKEGPNRITLENVLGEYAACYGVVEGCMNVLNELYRAITQITGTTPYKYIDYDIAEKIPGAAENFGELSGQLYQVVEELVRLSGEKNDQTALLETLALQLSKFAEDPERVVVELDSFKSNITALGNWLITISEGSLYVDSLTLYAPGTAYDPPTSSFFVKLWNGILRFFATFFVDENQVGDEEVQKDALEVWAPIGLDQARIVKNMVDDSFASQHDTPVNVLLIPADVILPATLAGTGPDVVLNMTGKNLVNFAMRNALVDVSGFPDYPDMLERYYPSAIQAGTYLDRVYGMPEQQWVDMMFVRDDILAELGIEIPRTWEEFTRAVTELNMHNYDAYVPVGTSVYTAMLYQNGGVLYEGQGADYGIRSGLYSEAAMKTFVDYTKFFTAYKVPVQADFPNRFRTGEMPLGIYASSMYNTLELLAPEIRGLWSMHGIPGVPDGNGGVDNQNIAQTNYTVIMANCADKDAAWDFVRWWQSTDVQYDYAMQLEAVFGVSGRYAPANKEVLARLPYPKKALDALLAQYENTFGIPEVPGAYMTERMLTYAFNAVVTDSSAMSPRQALYTNIYAIDQELTRKREEYHLSTAEEAASQ